MLRIILIGILLLLAVLNSSAQQKLTLLLESPGQAEKFFQRAFGYKSEFRDSVSAVAELHDLRDRLHKAAYLGASVDGIRRSGDTLIAEVYVGDQYEWASLENGNLSPSMLSATGYKQKLFQGSKLRFGEVSQLFERILIQSENNGYPFARVWLDSLQQTEEGLSAKIFLERHELISYDSARIHGETNINHRFLMSYLGIRKGMPYSEKVIQRIATRIGEMPYLSERKAAQVDFINDEAQLHLYLQDEKASRFNFLVGFLPNSQSGGLLVTGEALLHLVSPFGTGKEIYLNWQKLQPRTQNLELYFKYPYLFNFPLGLDAGLKLDKIDSLFLTVETNIGLQYLTIGDNYVKLFARNTFSNLLNVDTVQLVQNRQLPNQLDFRTTSLGLEYKLENLDYRFNPRSGFSILASGTAGARRVNRNSRIASIFDPVEDRNFDHLYDSIPLRSVVTEIGLDASYYVPIAKRSTFVLDLNSRYRIAKRILQNEKYRIGGARMLRGFDEESIYTPYYSILTAEYRFLLSRNSFFYAFFDQGLVEDARFGAGDVDLPFGFGAGLALQTKAGIFGVSYALGRQLDNQIEFRAAKIHLSYISLF